MVSVAAAEAGSPRAVLGDLSAGQGRTGDAVEVAVSRDGRYAFVSLEDQARIAVYDLRLALADSFAPAAYLGAIPTELEPVGMAFSPDGRWLYVTSEAASAGIPYGSLQVVSVAAAETDPARAVVATVAAGCNPGRVLTSADGSVVWVAARGSDSLLAFSADRLRADPARALIADVLVGSEPVGLALVRGGSLLVAADSNRSSQPGLSASLAVVDVADALAGRQAVLGYVRSGAFPREMAVVPGDRVLLVSNYSSDQLETVDLASLP